MSTDAPDTVPDVEDVRLAARRLAGRVVRTPLLSSPELDRVTGGRVWLKAENLQRTGSFKFRGATNALLADPQAARRGVVACSSGNHAQGMAEAARLAGVPCTIVMPADAPALKKQRTVRAGATVVEYDRYTEDREAIARGIAEREAALFVHPFENPHVIAGQGTCGLEIAEDLAAQGVAPDAVYVCTGGGGLLAGILLAVRNAFPAVEMMAVEPEGFDDQRRSLAAGRRLANEEGARSICDAIVTERPGRVSFAITNGIATGTAVSDDEALEAMVFAANELKTVVEPGGAVALAAVLKAGRAGALKGRNVVATLSGGNVEPAMLARALCGEAAL